MDRIYVQVITAPTGPDSYTNTKDIDNVINFGADSDLSLLSKNENLSEEQDLLKFIYDGTKSKQIREAVLNNKFYKKI